MNRCTPSIPVHNQLLEFTQTHVHQVGDAIQPSHPLSFPSPPAPNPSQHQDLFQRVNSVGKLCPRTDLESTFAGQVLCFLVLFYLGWFEKSRRANWLMHDLIFWLSTHISSPLSPPCSVPWEGKLYGVFTQALLSSCQDILGLDQREMGVLMHAISRSLHARLWLWQQLHS